ncbi:MAG: PIN domain-containing protein [Candidatus Nanoarchaeia archaeon]
MKKKKFYVDTCIYLNLWKKEENLVEGKPVWRIAKEFFEKNEEDSVFFYSGFILKELVYKMTEEEYNKKRIMFESTPNFRKLIVFNKNISEAREIESELNYEISFFDIIHLLLSKREGAILVTRDKKLLEVAQGIGISAGKPENFL